MNHIKKLSLFVGAGVGIGLLAGVLLTLLLNTGQGGAGHISAEQGSAGSATQAREPLYWVAPMDPNYRRDEPGKSPMGMDLIPVYEEGPAEPGTVQISPAVVNNLGVRTAPVERGRLAPHIKTVGTVQYDQDRLLNVDPRVEGWIERLYVKANGDSVGAGEPLYTIYSPTLVNAQEEFLLALNRNNPALISAATERLQALRAPQSLIKQLRNSRQAQQKVTITAPQPGVIDNLQVREGAYVMPGNRIMTIAQLDQVWVLGEVFERQLPFISEGAAATIQLDFLPGREWQGQVDYVYPTIDPDTGTAQIRVKVSNSDGALKPGMYTRLTLSNNAGAETLVIPREALIRTEESTRVVLVRGEGRFKSVAVSVGRIYDRQVEILDGLEEGERIVTSAQFLIDSESSKTSDFQRMQDAADSTGAANADGSAEPEHNQQTVWAAARVENVMPDHRMVKLYHEPIEAWQWPEMTMNFLVDESIDMQVFEPGLELHVQLTEAEDAPGQYRIIEIHIPKEQDESSAESAAHQPPSNDHSGHSHGHEAHSGGTSP